ncbi:MAG: biotin--[acetyl-CoA-carboxylase] ligase [Spirochaetales bacterium]|nr:biotin--[acetyl-CoA-carboxylase] ligase [Spirochaetales bacterium]
MKQLDIVNPFGNAPVWYMETTDTTMRIARELFSSGKQPGIAVVAGHQTAGRGRTQHRVWNSNPGESLLMTLVLDRKDFSKPLQLLPLLTGLGIVDFLETYFSLQAGIKWPNDVLVRGRKICGILCEASWNGLFIGIGLNLRQRKFSSSLTGLPFPPTSVALETELHGINHGVSVPDLKNLIPGLLSALYANYTDPEWQERLNNKLYGMHKQVAFAAGEADTAEKSKKLSGIIQGVADDGGLIIDSSIWYTGEISKVEFP